MSIINTNSAAQFAIDQRTRNAEGLKKSIEKLSSGLKINNASDDAAGLAISEKFRIDIKGIDRAISNAKDGQSMLQIADGAAQQINNILGRMKQLSIQAASNSGDSRNAINNEFQQLAKEVDRITDVSTFNGNALIKSGGSSNIQIGVGVTPGVDSLTYNSVDLTASTLGISDLDLSLTGDPNAAILAIDGAVSTVTEGRGSLGALQNRLSVANDNLSSLRQNYSDAESRIRDADMSVEMTGFVRSQILLQASTSALSNANQIPNLVLKLLG
jgi:flagellin